MARIAKDPDERRSELVAAARRLFFSKGYESTSVREIVEAVGVAQGTFYYYFDSKQDILEALVSDLAAQALARFKTIVADEDLNAVEKWCRTMRVMGNWKVERKDELLAFMRMVHADGNGLLLHKLRTQRAQMTVPILASIVEQGVEEGLFETPYVKETADMVYAAAEVASVGITGVLLTPQDYDHPEALVRRRIAALQTAMERMLGAPPGSLPIADEQTLAPWFED